MPQFCCSVLLLSCWLSAFSHTYCLSLFRQWGSERKSNLQYCVISWFYCWWSLSESVVTCWFYKWDILIIFYVWIFKRCKTLCWFIHSDMQFSILTANKPGKMCLGVEPLGLAPLLWFFLGATSCHSLYFWVHVYQVLIQVRSGSLKAQSYYHSNQMSNFFSDPPGICVCIIKMLLLSVHIIWLSNVRLDFWSHAMPVNVVLHFDTLSDQITIVLQIGSGGRFKVVEPGEQMMRRW